MNPDDFLKIGSRIEHGHECVRIDFYLAHKFPFLSRVKWQKRIENGEIRIVSHGLTVIQNPKITYKLKKYDQIWYHQPANQQGTQTHTIGIIHDDGDICIFSKPPHLVVHPVGIYGRNNFLTHVSEMGYKDCSPVHRIDRETSGILVCARKSVTRAAISKLFRDNKVKKLYFAITKGTSIVEKHFTVSSPIGTPDSSAIRLKLWVNGRNCVPAETEFYLLAKIEDYHLFACVPKTGRTNQIRIHLASVGQWIVGDKMYHPDENVFLEFYEKGYTDWVHKNVLFSRHLLHSAGIFIPGFTAEFIFSKIAQDMLDYPIGMQLFEQSGLTKDFTCLPIFT